MNSEAAIPLSQTAEISIPLRCSWKRRSLIWRIRTAIELGDWDAVMFRRQREIDAFCWILAGGTAALLLPICLLVSRV